MSNSILDDVKYNLRSGDNTTRLIIINCIIFLFFGLLNLTDSLFKIGGVLYFDKYFILPSAVNELLFKPWTLLTYMFMHYSIWHILGNMLLLYFGGHLFAEFLGNKKVVALYIVGGLVGGILFLILYNTLPLFANETSVILGSSASVLAIFFAISTYLPNYSVRILIIDIKLKYLALFIFVLDLLSIDQSNPGGHIAHIGGALLGIGYATGLRKGYDFTIRFNILINKISSLFSAVAKGKKSAMKVSYKQNNQPKNTKSKAKQEVIDAILDKISKSGYDSLTKEEQETIFKISKEE